LEADKVPPRFASAVREAEPRSGDATRRVDTRGRRRSVAIQRSRREGRKV